MELINNMKEISPMVAPTRSAKSSRVGPITPEVRPRALRKYEGVCLSQVKLPKKMLRSSIVLLSRCQGYFSTVVPPSKGIFSSSLLSIFINFGGESFIPCLLFVVSEASFYIIGFLKIFLWSVHLTSKNKFVNSLTSETIKTLHPECFI